MQQHNPSAFYELGKALAGISTLESKATKVITIHHALYNARNAVEPFAEGTIAIPPGSRRAAKTIADKISALAVEQSEQGYAIVNRDISTQDIHDLKKVVGDFEIVLANDMPSMDLFLVAAKRIYSTSALIQNADVAIRCTLSPEAQALIPSAAYRDYNEAGRCLAFEVATSAGFHTARAVEATVRVYWSAVTKKPLQDAPALANCIATLRKSGEDEKVLDALDHIRDLHRNTIMHPEAFLSVSEAMRLFDIAKSAISAVGERMQQIASAQSSSD